MSPSSTHRDRRPVARGTRFRILAPHPIRVEPRSVGVEPPSAERRVAGEAVALGVARDAGLEALARRLPVTDEEELLRVVITRPHHTCRHEASLGVARRAETADAVTIAARGLAPIRRRGVPAQEPRRVVSGTRGGDRPMAVEALGADVTPGAARAGRRGRRSMTVREVAAVRRGGTARRDRRRARIGCERRDRARRSRARVTLITELARVTGRAAGADGLARHGPVAVGARESRIGVGGRRPESGDVLAREVRGLRQRHVALCAGGVRGGEVGRANRMAVEASFGRGGPHGHPGRAGLGVARHAGRSFRARGPGVTHVIEPQIAAPGHSRRAPRHNFLDRPVVTGRARHGLGPERHASRHGAHVAGCTRRKERAVLLVVETRSPSLSAQT